jgi:hypothetical protein
MTRSFLGFFITNFFCFMYLRLDGNFSVIPLFRVD